MKPPLILHDSTQAHVSQFVQQPAHAVMLVGDNGIGKRAIAETMIATLLDIQSERLSNHPAMSIVAPEKDSISIDSIRELRRFLQLKTIGNRPLRRAVLIEHAETLTTEAQNAFLKLLEEPPSDTVILLTASNQRALLPTILSRVQIIPVTAPQEQALKTHFVDQGKEVATVTQAYFLSGGLPGLMTALLADDDTHPLMNGVATAKEILQKPLFERLALVDRLSKQKDDAAYTVQALQHIARTGLRQAAAKADPAKVRQWHHILKAATSAKQAMEQNANTKLVLSNLMLEL